MEKRIKLIWDFRGPEAELTAKHHAVHLKEFATGNKLDYNIHGYEKISELHSLAYLVVSEKEMKPVRDALKPHRGTIYSENK